MSYIDNTKRDLYTKLYMLESENEILRKQIIELKKQNNELLDNANIKRQTTSEEPNEVQRGDTSDRDRVF